jgi:hypothetical protein
MSNRSEALAAGVTIDDPGTTFPYITVSDGDATFKVWKRCRVELFDAFWVSEPISESLKPRTILHPSQVPDELWSVLTEEERLISQLQRARWEIERLKGRNEMLLSVLGVLCLTLLVWTFAHFS